MKMYFLLNKRGQFPASHVGFRVFLFIPLYRVIPFKLWTLNYDHHKNSLAKNVLHGPKIRGPLHDFDKTDRSLFVEPWVVQRNHTDNGG